MNPVEMDLLTNIHIQRQIEHQHCAGTQGTWAKLALAGIVQATILGSGWIALNL